MGYTHFLLLCGLSMTITTQAQECSYPRGPAEMELSDDDILLQSFPDGTKVTFVCKLGYRPSSGSGEIVCTAGTWSSVQLKCDKKNCGSLGNVQHGDISYPNGTLFGAQALISCDSGYMLVGKSSITCGDKGWLGRLPTCEVVTCFDPPTVKDGSYFPVEEVYQYLDAVEYTCQGDLILNGAASLSCIENGTFSPNPPTCVSVQCPRLAFINSEWDGGARFPYKYKDSVTFKCLPGYVMMGSPTTTCEIDNKWIPTPPTCTPRATPAPPTTTTRPPPTVGPVDPEGKPAPPTTTTTTRPPATAGPVDPEDNKGNVPKIVGGVFGAALGMTILTMGLLKMEQM